MDSVCVARSSDAAHGYGADCGLARGATVTAVPVLKGTNLTPRVRGSMHTRLASETRGTATGPLDMAGLGGFVPGPAAMNDDTSPGTRQSAANVRAHPECGPGTQMSERRTATPSTRAVTASELFHTRSRVRTACGVQTLPAVAGRRRMKVASPVELLGYSLSASALSTRACDSRGVKISLASFACVWSTMPAESPAATMIDAAMHAMEACLPETKRPYAARGVNNEAD